MKLSAKHIIYYVLCFISKCWKVISNSLIFCFIWIMLDTISSLFILNDLTIYTYTHKSNFESKYCKIRSICSVMVLCYYYDIAKAILIRCFFLMELPTSISILYYAAGSVFYVALPYICIFILNNIRIHNVLWCHIVR